MVVTISPGGHPAASGTQPATTLLVGTERGVVRLERPVLDQRWEIVALTLPGVHVAALVALDEQTVFAAAHSGGIYVSTDGAQSWRASDAGLAEEHRQHVFTLAAQRRGEQLVLWAGSQPPALYRSDDRGATWQQNAGLRDVPGQEKWNFPGPPHLPHVKHVAAHPAEPETLYVCIEQGALLRSRDDGATWEQLTGFVSDDDVWYHDAHRVVFRPLDPHAFYLTSGEGMYYTPDAGASWTHLTTRSARVGYPDALLLDPADERTLYTAGGAVSPDQWRHRSEGADPSVLRSTDGGATWHELRDGLPRLDHNIEAMSLAHWGNELALYAATTGGDVFERPGRALPWRRIAAGLPSICKSSHGLLFRLPRPAAVH